MVLGLKGKNRRSVTVQINYLIHIEEIKPWPPSQSLRSLRSVLIEWKNGECASGSTNLVAPSLGSVIGEGRIEFNESFRLHVTLLRDMSVRSADADVFQKNCLEFNFYESRRDKTVKGQLLGTAIIDLAEYGTLKETLSTSVSMNCKRSYRNTDQPLLFIKIQPIGKNRASPSSKENNGCDSVSALMNEEYAEEAEIASFTDDDVSSHSSAAAVSTSLDSNGFTPPKLEKNESNGSIRNTCLNDKEHPLASETRLENLNMVQQDTYKVERSLSYASSMHISSAIKSPGNGHASVSNSPNCNSLSIQKHAASPNADSSSPSSVYDNLAVNSWSRTRSSGHENLNQNFHEKLANYRDIVADVQRNSNVNTFSVYKKHTSSQDSVQFTGKNPGSENCDTFECDDILNGKYKEADKYFAKKGGDKICYDSVEDISGNEQFNLDRQNCMEDEHLVAQGAKDRALFGSNAYSFGELNIGMQGNILKSERLKNMKSERLSADSARNDGLCGSNCHAEVNENGILGDAQNSGGNRSNDRRDAKIYPKEARSATLDGKIEHLEKKIKMLEGELREAAAIEAALYSVVAEHGNSMSKVHAPARRLSRLYLHACKENFQGRKAGAAKSSVSGLVLVTKACGNDVPRLTFWLSNTIMLRTIISQTTKGLNPSNPAGSSRRRKTEGEEYDKIASSLRLKGLYTRKNENTALGNGGFENWEDPKVFILALEKVEAWIFSRIIESIWWQTLTPHMQNAMLTNKEVGSASSKIYRRTSSSCDQEQGNLSLCIWKNAFREACERLCPIRVGGHECGCLPMLPRLIMEQCVARLDVAMFNAILRESADEMPTDPVSDAISDPKVLPIPPGKSSFGAGAQLKTVIGNWSRWLTDLFGMDEDDSLEDKADLDKNEERQNASFKSFSLLNALSDLLMLPKDMLLSASIRNEVCPIFNAPLIKKILDNFVPDEFCPDPVPSNVFEALDSKNDMEDGKESINNFPCIAAPIVYSPPSATFIASIVGEMGSKSKLRRNRSSVIRKSNTSDDELNELKFPLSLILSNGSSSSAVSTKSSFKLKETRNESNVRYELLRDVWMNSE